MTLTIMFTIYHVYQNDYVTNMYISGRILHECPFNQRCIIKNVLKCFQLRIVPR